MEEFQSVTRFDIESKLSKQMLMVSRIISSAMVFGPAVFLLFIGFMYSKNQNYDFSLAAESNINIFIYALFALGFGVYASFLLLPKFFLNSQNLKKRMSKLFQDPKGNTIDDPVMKLIVFDRMFMIIRLAQLEGVSLFGLVILFLAVSSGQIYQDSSLWFLVLPLVFQALFTFNNYLAKNKYIDRIETQILAKMKEY